MLDTAARFTQDGTTGLFLPTQVRRNVFPYDDLQILNPHVGYVNLTTDLLSTLAVMVAQGNGQGKLIAATDGGAMYSAAAINFPTKIAAPASVGATQIRVVDPNFGRQFPWIFIVPGGQGGQQQGVYLTSPVQGDATLLNLNTPLVVAVGVGDTVFAVPQVATLSNQNGVSLASLPIKGTDLNLAVSAGTTGSVLNSIAALIFPAVAGQRFNLKYLISALYGQGGAAIATNVVVHDGVNATDNAIVTYVHGGAATNVSERQYMDDPTCRTSIGNGCRIDFSATGATTQEYISAGGWYE